MAKIKHIAIATRDPERAVQFYKEVFELEVVGRLSSEDAEGYYLSDGNVNLAVIRFKTEEAAGEEYGTRFSGIHHIGFQVDDVSATDARLRKADAHTVADTRAALHSDKRRGRGGLNVAMRYSGPDGVMLDVSLGGWVGADEG